MLEKLLTRPHIRFMADGLLGLAIFGGLTVALLGPSSAATLLPIGLEPVSTLTGAMPLAALGPVAAKGGADLHSLIVLLAAVFSTLFALNLTFVRHIASAYRVARRPVKAIQPNMGDPNRSN